MITLGSVEVGAVEGEVQKAETKDMTYFFKSATLKKVWEWV